MCECVCSATVWVMQMVCVGACVVAESGWHILEKAMEKGVLE